MLLQSATIDTPLAISVLWCVYQMIPSGLVLLYNFISKGLLLQYACRLGILLSFFTGACAVGLMWGLYPPNYDFGHVTKLSTFYYDAQRVGDLPNSNQVSWRNDALVGQTGPLGRDMTGAPAACMRPLQNRHGALVQHATMMGLSHQKGNLARRYSILPLAWSYKLGRFCRALEGLASITWQS